MMMAKLFGKDMKSSLSDNAIAALNVIPIPVGKALKPLLKLVPNSLKTLLAKNGIGKISTRIDEASKSIYKKEDISVGEEIFPTYKIGNKQESFAFQGYKENLSSLSKSGVTTVETTPEGLLSAALGLSPKNRNISTMLDNFKNNKLGQEEYTFLDDISAAVSINSKGVDPGVEKTDGFAMVLAALSGDKNAKKIIEYKRKKFYDLVEKAKASNKSHRDASEYKPKEGPVDPASVPVIHSTGYGVVRDKNGDVVLNPFGDFNIGTDKAVPRGSLHTTLYAPVESHLMGQWDASQTRIVSSLENMTQANGLPYNVNATDTWWQVNPGQGLTVPNPSIIRSFQDSKAYREELIRRGLLQPTEMTPPLSVDSGLKEVLHLQKEAYNSVERLQISRIAREMGLAREVVPGQETQMLQEIALRHAKQQQGVDAGKARLEQWGLSNEDLNQHIYRIAQQYGVDSGIHSGSHPELLEKILMRESASRNQNGIPSFSKLFVDSLEAIRMATRHGRFKTEIEKVKDPFDEFAMGGLVRKFADGGMVKSNSFKKYVQSLSGMPGAEMFGTASLLRKITGQSKKGDNLSAALLPLNFSGAGILSKAKSLAYKPINLVNQYMNYFKAKKMLKSGVYHGSADLGRNSDGPFSGITELSGDYARDPYHGMGFFGTTSKSEADLYAGGYNVPGQWGESYGSLNKITKLPFGRYLDFTKDIKNQNYAMWKIFQSQRDKNFMGAHEQLGSIMNDAGMTGAIMPRISAGMAPDEINLAKWIALNKPEGAVLEELGSGFANGGLVKNKVSRPTYSLPSFDTGISYLPKDMIAQLHEGERVLTKEENKNFSSGGPITNNIIINGTDLNKKEIAQEVMIELDRVQKKNNKTNLVSK
jgi:hypothetical protein